MNWANVGLCLVTTLLMMWIVWFELEPKAIVFFIINLAVCEAFIQIRRRLSLVCPYCHFDPILYKKDSKKAADRVRAHFDQLQESPQYYLRLHPLQKRRLELSRNAKNPLTRAKSVSVTAPRTL